MTTRVERQMTSDGMPMLQPLSWVYRGGVAWARARRAGKPTTSRPRVVSVGNLAVGGSGKTPFALWLVQRALTAGCSVAYASRGFGGAGEHGPWVTWVPAQGAAAPASFAGLRIVTREAPDVAHSVGDEAAMVARRAPDVHVLVSRDKRRAIAVAAAMSLDVVVVDDAFQSFALARHVDIVMLDAHRPLGNGRMLPAGPLREPPSALARADVIVFNGAADATAIAEARKRIAPWLTPSQRVYGLRRDVVLVPVTPAAREKPRDALLVAGIARPEGLAASIGSLVATTEMVAFRDHHRYNEIDVRRIGNAAGRRAIVTTEKDWVKLSRFDWGDQPVWLARLDVELVGDEAVDRWLLP